MAGKKQTYQYKEAQSIIYRLTDEYALTETEYFRLYSFFVTYSMCKAQSTKKRTIEDYGWVSRTPGKAANIVSSGLKEVLANVLHLDGNASFIFTDEDDLAVRFAETDLINVNPNEIAIERAVIGKTTTETNAYFKLFYRIRNAFAHGRFALRLTRAGEQIVIIQDNDTYNVTARIILRKRTLLDFARVVDRNNLLHTPANNNDLPYSPHPHDLMQ